MTTTQQNLTNLLCYAEEILKISGRSTIGERLVLIDGYRRVAALRRLGRDTARVEQWTCDLTDALKRTR